MGFDRSLPGALSYVWRAAFLLFALVLSLNRAFADENLLLNGDLLEGDHGLPAHWQAQSLGPDNTNKLFSWLPQTGGAGQLGITLNRPNSARWSQTIKTDPGWYCLRGEIGAGDVRPVAETGTLGVRVGQRTFGWSPDPGHPSEWSTGELYFKVGGPIKQVEVVCELTGLHCSVSCRLFSLTALSGPPPPGSGAIDLEAAEAAVARAQKVPLSDPFAPPTGNLWSLGVTIFLFIAVTVSGWLAFSASNYDFATTLQHDVRHNKMSDARRTDL